MDGVLFLEQEIQRMAFGRAYCLEGKAFHGAGQLEMSRRSERGFGHLERRGEPGQRRGTTDRQVEFLLGRGEEVKERLGL